MKLYKLNYAPSELSPNTSCISTIIKGKKITLMVCVMNSGLNWRQRELLLMVLTKILFKN